MGFDRAGFGFKWFWLWFGLGWFGLVWFGSVWFGLVVVLVLVLVLVLVVVVVLVWNGRASRGGRGFGQQDQGGRGGRTHLLLALVI